MSASAMSKDGRTSCGVIVTDGPRVLLGHATRSPRWDIPKGLAEPGETHRAAAIRELREETGLAAPPEALIDLGVYRYLRGKDLALMLWKPVPMPDPATLVCSSTFIVSGAVLPEFDRFGIFPWDDALRRVGKGLAQLLERLAFIDAGRPTGVAASGVD
jgi:8-oxo-dGTP pyrophosphatase MutT (NUDIX family)